MILTVTDDRLVLAFDVGGTTIRAGIYDPGTDAISREVRAATRNAAAAPGIDARLLIGRLSDDLTGLARIVWPEEPGPAQVAIAFPGPLSPRGDVLALPTVLGAAGTAGLRVPDLLLLPRPDMRVVVLNDVTAAGHAVMREPGESFCIVTVSSGIGMKLFIDGKAVVGPYGRGGEIGHVVVAQGRDAHPCDCGGSGHLGSVASGRGVLASARRRMHSGDLPFDGQHRLDEYAIAEAFRAEQAWAIDLIAESAGYLGRVLACVHTATGVERFVIVGGFAVALGDPYREILAAAAAESCWDLGQSWPHMIELVDLHDQAGMLGAGRYLVSEKEAASHAC